MEQRHILIFDSGVGGLSIYKEIEKQLPNASYTYVFDNAGYPYGELEEKTLIQRICRYIGQFLEKNEIDLIVVGCNSASTVALPSLRAKFNIPVVGVVPAIKPAALISKKSIGLIATPATVQRPYTKKLIEEFSSNIEVKLLGSTTLVDMAEAKLRGYPVNLEKLTSVLLPELHDVDVAILGCTHFPWLRKEIEQVFGVSVTVIDSGMAIANRVVDILGRNQSKKSNQTRKIFCSAPPYKENALNLGLTQLGFESVEVIPLQDA